MSAFNIKEDLEFRLLAQRADILACSGPTAQLVMLALKEKRYSDLARFGLDKVTDEIAEPIVKRYGKMILGH